MRAHHLSLPRVTRRASQRVHVAAAVAIVLFHWAFPAAASAETLPAGQTLLSVPETDYYRIWVESDTGARMELIDRMLGEIAHDGDAGSRDGSLDLPLLAGEYRVQVHTAPQATRTPTVRLRRYVERNTPEEMRALLSSGTDGIATTVGDLDVRSFWMLVPGTEDQDVFVHAMGETFGDLSLWRDGEYLVSSDSGPVTLVAGTTYHQARIARSVEPGWYLVRITGKSAGGEAPVYVRTAYPAMEAQTRQSFRVRDSGVLQVRLGEHVRMVEVTRDEALPLTVDVDRHTDYIRGAEIPRDATVGSGDPGPVVRNYHREDGVVRVIAPVGSTVTLTALGELLRPDGPFLTPERRREPGRYFISGFLPARDQYSLDLTPAVVDPDGILVIDGAFRVSPDRPLVRTVNLGDEATVLIRPAEAGSFALLTDPGRTTADPWYVLVPMAEIAAWNPPVVQPNDAGIVSLEETTYLLVMGATPGQSRDQTGRGILRFAFTPVPRSASENQMRQLTARAFKQEAQPRGWFTLPNVTMEEGDSGRSVFMVNLPTTDPLLSTDIRALPIALLERPLGFYLEPGEAIGVDVELSAASRIRLRRGRGSLWVDGARGLDGDGVVAAAGAVGVQVESEAPEPELFVLEAVALEPRVPAPKLDPRPEPLHTRVPTLRPGESVYADYRRDQQRSYLVSVPEAGRYRIQRLGRLSLHTTLRDFLNRPIGASATQRPGARNYDDMYLRPGRYVLHAGAAGQSEGRAGIRLGVRPTQHMADASPGEIVRLRVPAGTSATTNLSVPAAGRYSLEVHAFPGRTSYRLEDAQGFPVAGGTSGAARRVSLDEGTYRLWIGTDQFGGNRLVRLLPSGEGRVTPASTENPGVLAPNTAVDAVWADGDGGHTYEIDTRAPFEGTLTVSAGLDVAVTHDGEIVVEHTTATDSAAIPVRIPGPGTRVELKPIEARRELSYGLGLQTDTLLPGERLSVLVPREIPIHTATDGRVIVQGFGSVDTLARLLDAAGNVLAVSDDEPMDHNFRIQRTLRAGAYSLHVEHLTDQYREETEVSLAVDAIQDLGEQPLPLRIGTRAPAEARFATPADELLIHFRADNGRFELLNGDRLIATGTQAYVPLRGSTTYRVTLSPSGTVRATLTAEPVPVSAVTVGEEPRAVSVAGPVRIRHEEALSLRFTANVPILAARGPEEAAVPDDGAPAAVGEGFAYVIPVPPAAPAPSSGATLAVTPLRLEPGDRTAVRPEATPESFHLAGRRDAVTLVWARCPGRRVGLTVVPPEEYHPGRRSWNGAVAVGESVTGVAGAEPVRGVVFATGGAAPGRVDLEARAFPVTVHSRPAEEATVRIPPGSAAQVDAGAGNAASRTDAVQLVLQRGLVAVGGPAAELGVHAAAEANVMREGPAGTWFIVNTGRAEALARLTRTTPTTVAARMEDGVFEYVAPGGARVSLPVPEGEGIAVGTIRRLEFKGADGTLLVEEPSSSPARIPLPGTPGSVELTLEPGWVRIGPTDFSFDAPTPRGELREGGNPLGGGPEAFQFSLDARSQVVLESGSIGLLRLETADRRSVPGLPREAVGGPDGGRRIVASLPAGRYRVLAAPIAAAPQTEALIFSAIQPIELTGAEAPYRFIGPGEEALYVFQVIAASRVGVGVRAEADEPVVELLDAELASLGTGRVLFRELDPGRYFLRVTGGDEPVLYAPVLYGHRGSLDSVPRDVIEQYREER